jgi:methylated-DNA-protein-cysteine methyltransferase-like protein
MAHFLDRLPRLAPARLGSPSPLVRRVAVVGGATIVALLRQAGYALANLPADREIPWQRVVNARGEVSPRAGDPGLAQGFQRHLLEEEGVEFDRHGRIDLRRFQWDP